MLAGGRVGGNRLEVCACRVFSTLVATIERHRDDGRVQSDGCGRTREGLKQQTVRNCDGLTNSEDLKYIGWDGPGRSRDAGEAQRNCDGLLVTNSKELKQIGWDGPGRSRDAGEAQSVGCDRSCECLNTIVTIL